MIGLVDGNNFFVSCERVFNRRLVGRPVAVLSNNDGCCVSRSNEFKALGIPMGTPYFQLKHREASGELCFGDIFITSISFNTRSRIAKAESFRPRQLQRRRSRHNCLGCRQSA